ncbi:MAG: glycosyltransferase family 4 protein [bacterium]
MKIAMIGQKGIPATYGGIEKHVEELSSRLAGLGHDVTVFCRPYYTNPSVEDGKVKRVKEKCSYRGINLKILASLNTKHLDAITHTAVSSMAALSGGFDIIHYHALGPSLLSFLPRVLSSAGVIATVHGLDWHRNKWRGVATWALKAGELATAWFPHRTIVVSRTLKKYYRENHSRCDCHYLPNGQELISPLKPGIISGKYGLNGNDYLLFVGRLVPEKGCHSLISAFKKVDTAKRLVIAGGSSHSDEYQQELHNMAADDPRILFTGYVYGDELKELYSNCCLFLLPSELEGLPIVLLEALGYGCPALVSDIPENMEVIAPDGALLYGYKFRNRNVDDLQENLTGLLNSSPPPDSLREKVKSYLATNYNWDRITLDTMKVYQEALG